jgi:hypothetical protein
MQRVITYPLRIFAIAGLIISIGHAQDRQASTIVRVPISPTSPDVSASLTPLEDPATITQIHEYLRLSGDLDSFRVRWIAALDKNRSLGEPYWPESFWTALKAEMQKTDLMPMFVTLYQHGISRGLMQEVIDAYLRLGAEHFQGSPECFKLGTAELALTADIDNLKLAKTEEVFTKVYTVYKPEIKAARVRYVAEHPEWVDK